LCEARSSAVGETRRPAWSIAKRTCAEFVKVGITLGTRGIKDTYFTSLFPRYGLEYRVMPKTIRQLTGNLGEDVACKFLAGRGYKLKKRNYLKQFGEIDIVVEKDKVLHFVEVKTKNVPSLDEIDENSYEAEENVHKWKIERLQRAVAAYLMEFNVPDDVEYQIDVVAVYLEEPKATGERRTRVRYLPAISL